MVVARLPRRLAEDLTRAAEERGCSRSDVVRSALRRELRQASTASGSKDTPPTDADIEDDRSNRSRTQ